MAGNGQMVIDLDKKRMTAMAQKDITTLNRALSDEPYLHAFIGPAGYQAELDRQHGVWVDGLYRGRAF